MSGDLLQTKLYVPRLRPFLIPRPHLINRLLPTPSRPTSGNRQPTWLSKRTNRSMSKVSLPPGSAGWQHTLVEVPILRNGHAGSIGQSPFFLA
ncbi:MAG: hypothetical protein GY796_25630 [Chloroflexi bacterium]|nr:hypothetical protein [Chloroflexota bacterium]